MNGKKLKMRRTQNILLGSEFFSRCKARTPFPLRELSIIDSLVDGESSSTDNSTSSHEAGEDSSTSKRALVAASFGDSCFKIERSVAAIPV